MTERSFHDALLLGSLVVAAAMFVVLFFVSAPYGRHSRGGWGPMVHRKIGWLVMESPPILVMAACFAVGRHRTDVAAIVLLGLWMLHYVHRDLVFPWRMSGRTRTMPLTVVGMGIAFNLVNGYLQGRWLFEFGPARGAAWLTDPRLVVGCLLFGAGFALNIHSDAVLRRLGRKGEYGIPRGGAFRWVSCPNYLGEIVEWTGWAVATWSLPGAAFALWTAANLVPRARSHHRWYRARFADYPARRRAIIPYLF